MFQTYITLTLLIKYIIIFVRDGDVFPIAL